jgi:hypothetical protein
MKRFNEQKPAEKRPSGRVVTGLRDVVDHSRVTPANPRERIAPEHRSPEGHRKGYPIRVTNINPETKQYNLSVIPTVPGANVIDKALTTGARVAQDNAERNGIAYDPSAAGITGPASALSDMRSEANWARHEMRPAKAVLFNEEAVNTVLLGLHEMVAEGERTANNSAAGEMAQTVAAQEASEAKGLLRTIDLQLNPELGFTTEPQERYLGHVATGAATVELPGQVASQPASSDSQQ